MLSGGRRMGEMYVLGLCYMHHRSGYEFSRDHNQKRFEQKFGKESWLLEKTKEMI